jgi:hypothetical protein
MLSAKRLLSAVLLGAWLLSTPSIAADSEAAALTMIEKLRLGDNLKALGFQTASNSQTYRIMIQSVGPDRTRALVMEELDKAKPKYQDQWNRNLASAYAPLFSTEELQSITQNQRQSPYSKKFLSMQNEVGAAMQTKSKGLLVDYVTEAVTNAFRRVVPAK